MNTFPVRLIGGNSTSREDRLAVEVDIPGLILTYNDRDDTWTITHRLSGLRIGTTCCRTFAEQVAYHRAAGAFDWTQPAARFRDLCKAERRRLVNALGALPDELQLCERCGGDAL